MGVLLASAQDVLDLEPDPALLDGMDIGVVGPHPDGSAIAFELRAFFPGVAWLTRGFDLVRRERNRGDKQLLSWQRANAAGDGRIADPAEVPGAHPRRVVGRPDDMTGEAVCAFVVLKQARPTGAGAGKIAKELRDWVGKEIGPIAKPKDIRFGDNLPKTRSGKIMRRLLRSIAKGEAITQDVSTLENPAILEQLKQAL